MSAKIFDGAAVVQMLIPGTAKTFQEYTDTVFIPYLSNQLATAQRVDIVWEVYIKDSLKDSTREKRGRGIQRRVSSTTQLPKNWKDFLHVNENKTALFKFLARKVICLSTDDGKVIYAIEGTNVLSTMTDADMTSLAFYCLPITHGETYGLLFMVVYSPLAYQYQACSIIFTIGCISITNQLSPVTFVMIQLLHDSLIITCKIKLCNEDNIVLCASNQWLYSVHAHYHGY